MLNAKIVVVSEGKIYGPFDNQQTAGTWLDNHDSVREHCELYSLWEVEQGTAERAQECGQRLALAA